MTNFHLLTALLITFTSTSALPKNIKLQTVKILGGSETYVEPGSIYQISSEELQNKNSVNVHEVLKDIPGVSVQQEDGLGLRPNIGLRGTHPHRSKKVTLLEDGVLLAPAPYSAPAAYYFPLMTKITGVEVYKGPSSIKYGPNSIGGAINFLTRDFKEKTTSQVNYSYGSFNTHKLNLWNSGKYKQFNWLAEVSHIESDGFKTLPQGGETGFDKNDVLLKTRYTFKSKRERILDLKFSWADERSNETYLGITQDDFNAGPYQRYEGSRSDILNWEHKQYQIKFFNEWTKNIFSDFSLYRNDFTRKWDKLNGFADNTIDVRDILSSPIGQNKDFLDVIKGSKDSAPSETLRFGINDRNYISQGFAVDTRITTLSTKGKSNHIDIGLLYHQDEIERSHLLQDAQVISGKVIKSSAVVDRNNSNIDKSDAFRVFAVNTYENSKFLVRTGVRFENVNTQRFDKSTNLITNESSDHFWVPGIGVSYKINDTNLVFVGANRGFTLPGPSKGPQIEPEEAINYELGFRHKGTLFFELVGFYSDYKNLLGTCSFSTGCNSSQLDVQFNGGEAKVLGLEFLTGTEITYNEWTFPIKLSATYTDASFDSSLTSTNKEWGVGQINPGDPLPYIPELVASLSFGVKIKKITSNFYYNWRSKVYDQAASANRLTIPSISTLNMKVRYSINTKTSLSFSVDNILGSEYVSSIRPFGLRPGAPRWFSAGVSHTF